MPQQWQIMKRWNYWIKLKTGGWEEEGADEEGQGGGVKEAPSHCLRPHLLPLPRSLSRNATAKKCWALRSHWTVYTYVQLFYTPVRRYNRVWERERAQDSRLWKEDKTTRERSRGEELRKKGQGFWENEHAHRNWSGRGRRTPELCASAGVYERCVRVHPCASL